MLSWNRDSVNDHYFLLNIGNSSGSAMYYYNNYRSTVSYCV